MLVNIRENSQGVVVKVILGLIILTFAIAGVGSYTNSVDTSVAEVNGGKISQQAFDKAYQSQRSRMQKQYGKMFNTLAANKQYMTNFRQGVLDNLINEMLMDQSANELGIKVSDQRLKKIIREMPEFQVNGVFDNNRYLALINQSGFFQSSDFRDYLRKDIRRRQLIQGIANTAFDLPYQEKLVQNLQNQKRDIRYATISSVQFKNTVKVSDAEIKTYYQEHQNQFETQEQVKVNYVTLSVANISQGISVSEKDINQYYHDNIDSYTQAEQRKVSHILIEFGKDKTKAKANAESLLVKINQGESFASLAKQFSTDTFSAEKGGDLGWISKGVMGDSFDKAAFALKKVGQVSQIIKSSFGYHIIKLTALKPAKVKSLDQVSAQIKIKLAHDKAQDKFFELQQKLSQVSYESPDSLDDSAKAIGGKVQTSMWLKRSDNVAPFNSNKVAEALFSDVVLKDGVNSDVIEVNDNLAMVLHLNEYQPAKIKPLKIVRTEVKAVLVAQKATLATQQKADELLAALKANKNVEPLLKTVNSHFVVQPNVARYAPNVDKAIVKAVFVLPHPVKDKISATSVKLTNGDLAVVQLEAVKEDTTKLTHNANLGKQLASQLAESAYQNYIDTIKAEAKISRRVVKTPAA